MSAASLRRRWPVLAGAAVLALGIGVGAGELAAPALFPSASSSESSTPRPPADAPSLLRFFHDREAGFSLSYPASWQPRESGKPGVAFVAARGTTASVLVRTVPLGLEIGPDDIAAARQLADRVVARTAGVQVLDGPKRITLGGLPGWWYLYSFEERDTGRRGIHSHYLLFDGETMLTLVFQSLPAERFTGLAPVFDRIASSFRPG